MFLVDLANQINYEKYLYKNIIQLNKIGKF